MAWIYGGVVTLTNGSKAVAGVGSTWIGNVMEGDQFNTPTGPYEVESVAANGSLQLVLPYAGPTISNYAYSIVPTQGRIVPVAKNLSTLLSSVGAMKDDYQGGGIASATEVAARVKKTDLAAPEGADGVGSKLPVSITGIELPAVPLGMLVRSSAIDLRRNLPGNVDPTGQINYSAEIQKILDYLRDFGGGRIYFPPNLSLKAFGLQLYTGIEIVANDWTSEFIVPAGSNWGIAINGGHTNFVPPGTPDPATNIRNVLLSGFAIRGEPVSPTFSEHLHLLNFNAVSDLKVEYVRIKGAQGDGIYLGSSNVNNVERHNERIEFDHLYMDGVNNQNRNAISIIDGSQVKITNFTGLRWTRGQVGTPGQPGFSNSMPGTIDLEPNGQAFSIIRDILIDGFVIDGGTGCGIAHLLPSNANLTVPIQRLTIRNGVIRNKGTGFVQDTNTTPGAVPHDLRIDNVTVEDCDKPFTLDSVRGAEITNLRAYRCNKQAQIGAVSGAYDIRFKGLRMFNCGRTELNALWVRTVDGLSFDDAAWIDAGRTDVAAGRALWFSDGSGKNISIINSSITSPTGKTTYPIGVSPAYTLDNSTCKWANNTIMAGGNDFIVPGRAGLSNAPTTGNWAIGNEVYRTPVLGRPAGWRATSTGTPAAGTWSPMPLVGGPLRGPSSTRPTKAIMGVVGDVEWSGTQYFDTSLGGALITWTGSGWVNSSGTAV